MNTPHVLDLALGLHVGMQRRQNEDAVGYRHPGDWHLLTERGVLLVLADGVGGLQDGELASDRAVRLVLEAYYAPGTFRGVQAQIEYALNEANRDIRSHYATSATTIVVAAICGRQLILTHLGDSRAYLQRAASHSLEQLTQDHTTAVQRPDGRVKYKLTAALGHTEKLVLQFVSRTMEASDRLLMMSDGVLRYFDNARLADTCIRYSGSAALTAYLIQESNRAGGIDNISVVVAELCGQTIDHAQLPHIAARMTPESLFVDADNLPDAVTDPAVIFGQAEQPDSSQPPPAVTDTPALTVTPSTGRRDIRRLLLTATLILLLAGGVALLANGGWFPAGESTTAPATTRTVLLPTSEIAPAAEVNTDLPPPVVDADAGPPPELAENQYLIFDDAVTTFTRIGESITAFVTDTGRSYRVHTLFAHQDTIWVRLYDPETERLGWVEKDDLSSYRLDS